VAETSKGKPTPVSTRAAADDSNEAFPARWTRLKKEAREQPAEKPQPKPEAVDPKAPASELPPLDKLTFDSDYRAFFHPKVDEKLRRAALRKLFGDPHFNVMDGLDVYIDDYSKSDPLPAEMLAQLKHGQQILAWAREDTEKTAAEAASAAAAQPPGLVEEQPAAPTAAAVQPAVEPLGENQNVEPRAKSSRES
jgi:hypothetical protein